MFSRLSANFLMSELDSLATNYLKIIDRFVENGGPAEDEYALYEGIVDHVFDITNGLTSNLDLVDAFREHLGIALSHATLQGLAYF